MLSGENRECHSKEQLHSIYHRDSFTNERGRTTQNHQRFPWNTTNQYRRNYNQWTVESGTSKKSIQSSQQRIFWRSSSRSLLEQMYHPSTSSFPFFFSTLTTKTYIEYTLKYSNQMAPLAPVEKVRIIQFQVFPGKSLHIPEIRTGIDPTAGFHSHSSPNYLEWYLFDERQCYPEYVSA